MLGQKRKFRFFVAFPNNINLYFRQGHKLLQAINVLKIKSTNVSLAEGVHNHIYQPSGAGSTRLLPATPHRLQPLTACNTSPPALSKMADGIRKWVKSQVIGPSEQLSLNKFLDAIIPSLRTPKIQNGCQGAPKWPPGPGKGCNPSL